MHYGRNAGYVESNGESRSMTISIMIQVALALFASAGTAFVVYGAIRADLATAVAKAIAAHDTATVAHDTATRAHARIDSMMEHKAA